jgi:Lar family restriction alleviation protein
MSVEILPCPFCGSVEIQTDGPCYTQFMCSDCGAATYDQESHEAAIAAWNSRPIPALEAMGEDKLGEMLAGLEGVTPGPWEADQNLPINRKPRVHGGDGSLICEIGNMAMDQDQWERDAAHIARCDPQTIRSLITRLQAAEALVERLKLEAQAHASEARTANSTIYEIYQVISGGKGEPGNWNGAEPVRAYVQAAEAKNQAYAEALEWQPIETAPKDGTVILAVTVEAANPSARMSWFENGVWVRIWKPEKFVIPGPVRWWPTHWQPLPNPPIATLQQGAKP